MANPTTFLEAGSQKLEQLQDFARSPAIAFLNDCFSLGYPTNITEVYRAQARQDVLYAQGRTTPGAIVTWVKLSKHTDRLAFDAYPIKMLYGASLTSFYLNIEQIANKYGIVRPKATLAVGDMGHFEVDSAHLPFTPLNPLYTLKALTRRAYNELNPDIKAAILRQITRLKQRLGIS